MQVFHVFDGLEWVVMEDTNSMKLVQFQEKYRQAFIDFNTDWIVSNFGFLEEHDKETFEKIDEELNNGAKRLFIISNSKLKPALHIYEKNGSKTKSNLFLYDNGLKREV